MIGLVDEPVEHRDAREEEDDDDKVRYKDGVGGKEDDEVFVESRELELEATDGEEG